MKRTLTALLVANLLAGTAPLQAQETGLKWSGETGVGLRLNHLNAADPSKFREYRDIGNQPIFFTDLRGESDTHRFNVFMENLTEDDRYIDVRGTRFGAWKFRVYDSEFRHRFGSAVGAKTPFSGAGSPVLTLPAAPSPNNGTWNSFDDSLRRRDTGAMAEWSANSPWYVRLDGNHVTRDGVKVIAGSKGTSPGNGSIDLPAPVDWTTRNYSGEAGYQGRDSHFAVNAFYSKFENDNQFLRWSNDFFAPGAPGLRDTSVLPADNTLWRIAANGNVRGLPWGSTLAGRATYSKLTNEVQVLPTMLAAGPTFPSSAASAPVFNGEIATTTISAALNSHPSRAFDTKLYYNFRNKENNSNLIVFTPTAASGLQCGGGPCTPELFSYEKHNAGLEAFYRVNSENRLGGGYDYLRTTRERIDLPKTIDHKFFAEWRSSMVEQVDGRLRYQYLHRSSVAFPYADPGNPVDAFVRRFDQANVDQHLVKLALEWSPAPLFDTSFDVIYKHNDFRDTPLGRSKDQRQEYYASVGYGDPKRFRMLLFADIEYFDADSAHRVGAGTPNPGAPPEPAAPAVSTTYTWNADSKDKSWQVGISADYAAWEKLKLYGSLIWAQTKGTVDFAAQPGTILAAPFLPITNYDNTKRLALNLKSTYLYDKSWQFTAGYAFEHYKYSDIGYDYFAYVIPAAGGATSYYTGQGAFQPHNAHILYLYATYRFGQ